MLRGKLPINNIIFISLRFYEILVIPLLNMFLFFHFSVKKIIKFPILTNALLRERYFVNVIPFTKKIKLHLQKNVLAKSYDRLKEF